MSENYLKSNYFLKMASVKKGSQGQNKTYGQDTVTSSHKINFLSNNEIVYLI